MPALKAADAATAPAVRLSPDTVQHCQALLNSISEGLLVVAAAVEPRGDADRELPDDLARGLERLCFDLSDRCFEVKGQLEHAPRQENK
jgi:hypothetical protein